MATTTPVPPLEHETRGAGDDESQIITYSDHSVTLISSHYLIRRFV